MPGAAGGGTKPRAKEAGDIAAPSEPDSSVARERASAERATLAQLPNAQREVIHLHRYEQTWRSRGRRTLQPFTRRAGANASAVSGPTIAQMHGRERRLDHEVIGYRVITFFAAPQILAAIRRRAPGIAADHGAVILF